MRCRAKGLKVNTVRGIARTLSTILSQAVDEELLSANPALRLGKCLRLGDATAPEVEPFTRHETRHLIDVTAARFPDWHPWLLCGLRTGMRAGKLLGLQWSDINWRGRYIYVKRNIVRGPRDDTQEPSGPPDRSVAPACCDPAFFASTPTRGVAEGGKVSTGVGIRVRHRDGTGRVECAQGVQLPPRCGGA